MGRSISDRLSYRNHYMCSGEATSIDLSVMIPVVRIAIQIPVTENHYNFVVAQPLVFSYIMILSQFWKISKF